MVFDNLKSTNLIFFTQDKLSNGTLQKDLEVAHLKVLLFMIFLNKILTIFSIYEKGNSLHVPIQYKKIKKILILRVAQPVE